MEIVTSWELRGMEKGKEEMISRQIRKRFGVLPEQVIAGLENLSSPQLDDLGEEFLDFESLDDVTAWLTCHLQN